MKKAKKKFILSLMAAIIMLSPGCGESKDKGYTPDPNADYTLAAKSSAGSVHEVEMGIYRLENKGDNYYIKYADKSDMENWVYLCNKPNCKHDGFDCNAYIESGFPVIWIYEDKIYFNGMNQLYRMNMDGSDHEKVRDLPGIEMESQGGGVGTAYYNINGKFIYATLPALSGSNEEVPERTVTAYDISLKDEKEDKVFFEKALYTAHNNLITYLSYASGHSKGKDIFHRFEEKDSDFVEVYYEYNSEDNSLVELNSDDLYLKKSYFEDNIGYYYDNGFIKKNMDTGETSKVTEAAINNGDGLITDKYFLEFNKPGLRDEEKKLVIYDREGKLLNELDFDRDSEIFRMGFEMYWTSDRLFFSVIYEDLSEDIFYIFYEDIGDSDAELHYSYTDSWQGILKLEWLE